MAWDRSLSAVLFLGFIGFVASSFISDSVFDYQSTGRSLLQTKKSCPVNFEFQNYTIITSKCKGPQYSPKLCCPALKEFACPFADSINDLTTDCASTMFSYINLYGKYPPGLFSSQCKEGKDGLSCEEVNKNAIQSAGEKSNSKAQIGQTLSPFLITVSFLVLLSQFF